MDMEQQKLSAKNILTLVALSCAAFVFNTSEFVPIGLLSDIAADFGRTEAQAGMLISSYAWVVMLLSLPLALAFSRMKMRQLLLAVISVFTVFQGLSYLSTSYAMLLCSRLGVACAHSLFWAIILPIAVQSVPPKFADLAMSVVVTGTSIAVIMGMPLGRTIGLMAGWRAAFLCLGLFSLVTLVFVALTLPQTSAGKGVSLKNLPTMLSNHTLLCIYLLTFLFVVGYYTAYSYIEPYLKQVGGMPENLITLALMIFGCAGLLGSVLFSKYYSRGRRRFVTITIAGLLLTLVLLLPLSGSRTLLMLLCALWGFSVTAYNLALQRELLGSVSCDESAVAMSIYSGIFNFGIATGAVTGGAICTHLNLSLIGPIAAIAAAAALVFWLAVLCKKINDR